MTRQTHQKLPGRFADLVSLMPPRAIEDDVQHENTVEMIDRLMAIPKLTEGQASYMETLVQLVQAYESRHHAIQTADLSGIEMLRHLVTENHMSGSDLARLLGVHISMGSKILNGDRSLTVEHICKLADRFKVSCEMLMP